jgi:hypothetical protein
MRIRVYLTTVHTNELQYNISFHFHKYSVIQNFVFVRFDVFMAVAMKNVVFWDVALCESCKNRRISSLRLVVTANVVPSSPIRVALMT